MGYAHCVLAKNTETLFFHDLNDWNGLNQQHLAFG